MDAMLQVMKVVGLKTQCFMTPGKVWSYISFGNILEQPLAPFLILKTRGPQAANKNVFI